MTVSARKDRRKQLIDAAHQILVCEGYSAVTTRKVAAVAGLNQALVHYYFASMSDLVAAVLDRMHDVDAERVALAYSGDASLASKWREHMRLLFAQPTIESGDPKIYLELSTLAITKPELRELIVPRMDFAHDQFVRAAHQDIHRLGLNEAEIPVEGYATLAIVIGRGLFTEELMGVDRGHRQMFELLEGILEEAFGARDVAEVTAGS